jgi:2-polyprenyl-3-methyl-5-hydroxy-6-metoxy-1,4-benzoquinol methylase/glycosyltransferase involved in cell wall biosynthesis
MSVVGCTIVARNYLPAARVLAKSFREHHPDTSFGVLVVDDRDGQVDESREPFGVIRLSDIGIEPDEALRMAAIYDVMELCTAVKPWFLRRLLDDGAQVVIYLDPDIKVYALLDEAVTGAKDAGIVLTPHVTRPMPRDGMSKSEYEVLLSGIYNLGFIAVSGSSVEFLSFWQERLRRECIVDPANMRFVDQRWVDFVPGIWPAHIIRDPSYNVAYWNLDHRELSFDHGRYFVEGRPLHFFHFSGYSPDSPYLLSKHQGYLGNKPRILLSEHPVVARICDEYGAELLANGYAAESKTEYAYGRLANGLVLNRFMRRLYREALMSAERTGSEPPPNPLEPRNAEAFLAWLLEPPDSSPDGRLSRYLMAVHGARVDLQRAFPDPDGANFEAFASWAHHEVQEGRLDPRLAKLAVPQAGARLKSRLAFQLTRVERRLEAVPLPGTADERVRLNLAGSVRRLERALAGLPVPSAAERAKLNTARALGRLERRLTAVPLPGTADERVRLNLARRLARLERRLMVSSESPESSARQQKPREVPGEAQPGIRVAGYLRTESGVGELGRLAVASVERAGIPVSTYLDSTALSRQGRAFNASGPDRLVNLVCVNADELPNFAKRAGADFFEGHYTIGLWAWELEEFPEVFSTSFSYVDEVWGISSFTSEAIASTSTKPVYAFPLPVVEPQVSSSIGRPALGLPESFVFLFCFDLLSIFERKNPLGLIEAFSKAFSPGEGPTLVIKVVNGDIETGSLERLKLAAAQRPDVVVVDRYLDHEANVALMAACDCYVSLHRSEGFGLTLAEAMALGKPVIATGYSGNLDFMTPETSYLVPWKPGSVPVGCSPYPAGARWAEPDLDVAARMMRDVFENQLHAAEVGRRAKAHVLAKHGLDAGASFIRERFEAAQSVLTQRTRVSSYTVSPAVPDHAGSLVELARRPRDLNVPSKHPRSARLFRRVVWRALRSHDDHDREVHVGLASGIEGVLSEVAQLRESLQGAQTQYGRSVSALRAELLAQRRRLEDEAARVDKLGTRLDEQGTRLDEQGARLDVQDVLLGDHGSWLEQHESRLGQLDWPERLARIDQSLVTSEELRAVPFMSDPGLLMTTNEQGRPIIGYGEGSKLASGYATFEDLFRGPEEMIRDRFVPYLGVLADHGPVLDLGCGRGELLDLLAKAGIEATGVDIDRSMVERARAKGHTVVEQDAIEYLSAQPAGSLGAVFSAQVIEHLSAEAVKELLRQAHRVLRPSGLMVLETVNPYSVQAFRAFWTDLTHRHPIHPEALVVYCAEAGFEQATVRFPNGTGDLAKDRWSEGEYAVIARACGHGAPAPLAHLPTA